MADDHFSDEPVFSSAQEFTENTQDRGSKGKQEQHPNRLEKKKPSDDRARRWLSAAGRTCH